MTTRTNVFWAVGLALVAAAWAASVLIYPRLPATIPTHWDLHGKVDRYGPKGLSLFLLPAFMASFLVFFRLVPILSPRNFEVDSFRPTYLFLMVVSTAVFAYLHAVILLATWQAVQKAAHPVDIGRAMFAGVFLFLALVGNVLGKIRRNFYMGVRTPWTLASDRVWNDTHRLAAWTMVAGGLTGFVTVAAGVSILVAFAVLAVSCLVPVLYSFVHYKQLEKRGAL